MTDTQIVVAAPEDEGQLPLATRRIIVQYCRAHVGTLLEIRLRPWKARRSTAQNARYWALLAVAATSLWGDPSDKDNLHEEIAHLLLALPPCPKTGLRRRRATPSLNTREFAEYTDLVADKLIELGADLSSWDAEAERVSA